MASKKKEPVLIPGERWTQRRSCMLSCTECPRQITVMAFQDSEQGDGWPQHRCGREVRPFNQCEVL